jgi:hypothetical protein
VNRRRLIKHIGVGADLPWMIGKLLLVGLVAVVAAFAWTKHEDRVREQDRLARIASQLAGRPVGVRCPSFFAGLVDVRGEAGSVQFDADGRPANYTNLAPDTCDELRNFSHVDFSCLDTHTCSYKQFEAGWAAHTLAHEAFHLRGFADEGITECYAMQNTAFVAEELGLSNHLAQELQHWIFEKGFRNEPTEYQSAECYRGGPLDLTPQTPSFP